MFVWVIKIIQYEKIYVSEEIDTNKTSASKECTLCYYWYFKVQIYKLWLQIWTAYINKCRDVLMSAYELKNIAALTGKGADGRFISWGISKNEAVNISNNSLLEDKAVL